MKPIYHYASVLGLLVVAYFLLVSPIVRALEHGTKYSGPAVVSVQPTPSSAGARSLEVVAQALKEKALIDAISGQSIQNSVAQQAVASAISSATGASSRLAGALAEGLTKPSPKVQVITVGTKADSRLVAPALAPNDDAIRADMKAVLAETTIATKVSSDVKVSWQDKPFSPIFAAYFSNGTSGAGYTITHDRYLNLDALVLREPSNHIGAGVGIEHQIKGTSAGIGIGYTFDFGTRKAVPGLFASIRF